MSGAIALAAGLQSRKHSTQRPQTWLQIANAIQVVNSSPPESISFVSLLPIYILTAISEILAVVTSMEYAYTKAPKSMKSLVASINLLLCAIGSLLGLAVSPTSTRSRILVQFATLSGIAAVLALAFYLAFNKYNEQEDEMNKMDREST